jgi:hypothetical protein
MRGWVGVENQPLTKISVFLSAQTFQAKVNQNHPRIMPRQHFSDLASIN